MAYISIDVDIEDYLDEIDSDDLLNELKRRAKEDKKSFVEYVREIDKDLNIESSICLNRREEIAEYIGLNRYASKEDIIREILDKM